MTVNFFARPGYIVLGQRTYDALCCFIGGSLNAYRFQPNGERVCYEIPTILAYKLQAQYAVTFKCIGTVTKLYN